MLPSEKRKKAGNTQGPAPSTVFSFSLLQRTEVRTVPSGTRRCLRYCGGRQVNWENQCHFFTTTETTSLNTSSLLHCSSPSSCVTWPELAVHSLISCPGEPPHLRGAQRADQSHGHRHPCKDMVLPPTSAAFLRQ